MNGEDTNLKSTVVVFVDVVNVSLMKEIHRSFSTSIAFTMDQTEKIDTFANQSTDQDVNHRRGLSRIANVETQILAAPKIEKDVPALPRRSLTLGPF